MLSRCVILQLTFRLLCNPDSHVLNVSSLCISSWLFCCCNSCFFSSFNLFPILSSAPPLGVRCLFLLSSGCSDTTSMISSFSLTYERKMEQSELLSSILTAFGNISIGNFQNFHFQNKAKCKKPFLCK